MFKKITNLWKQITKNDSIYKLSEEELAEARLFIDSLYENGEYQAIARANKSDPVKYSIKQEYHDAIQSKALKDIVNNNVKSPSVQYFLINPVLMENRVIIPLFQNFIQESFANSIFRHHILNKNADLINVEKFNTEDFQARAFCDFITDKIKEPTMIDHLKEGFSKYLKEGAISENEEVLYCIAAQQLTPFFQLSDIQKSSFASNRVSRTFFSEFRQLSENNKVEKPQPAKKEVEPFKLSSITPTTLPSSLKTRYDTILTLVKKYQDSKIKNEYEDSYFLDNLMNKHLPETLSQYLQIDVNYRDKKLSSNSQTATEITADTLDLYLKRLEVIGNNLSNAALQKLQANKLLIARMSNNITLLNQGIIDVPDELEIQAPEVPKRIMSINKNRP